MVSLQTIGILTAVLVIMAALFKRWIAGGWCNSKARLDGKTVIITGCNTGIGKESARDLAKRGARVIMACRDINKANEACLEIIRDTGSSNVVVKQLDLASMKSIREFAAEIKKEESKVDILLNNAGIMGCPRWETEDGFEMQLGVNHLGHFLLTNLLLDLIKASAPSRIVNVSSSLHSQCRNINFDDIMMQEGYKPTNAYAQSKLANVLFTRELAKRLEGSGVTVYALHPGVVHTDLGRHFTTSHPIVKHLLPFLPLKTAVQGAQTNIHCCIDEGAGKETGLYYSDCAVKKPSKSAEDDDAARRLWDISTKLVGLDK